MTGQFQLHLPGRRMEKWNPTAKENWDDGNLHRVHKPPFEETAKKRSATEKPDILSRHFSEIGQRFFRSFGDNSHVWMVALPERSRKDQRFHSGHRGTPLLLHHALERSASHKGRVELIEQRTKVDVGIHYDPVEFTVWACDVPIQTGSYLVANPSHEHLQRI